LIDYKNKKQGAFPRRNQMIISDLSILEVVQANEVVGGYTVPAGTGNNSTQSENGIITFNEALNIVKNLASSVVITGNLATVQSTANATGTGTVSEVFTATNTTPYSSSASGTSISGSNSGYSAGW